MEKTHNTPINKPNDPFSIIIEVVDSILANPHLISEAIISKPVDSELNPEIHFVFNGTLLSVVHQGGDKQIIRLWSKDVTITQLRDMSNFSSLVNQFDKYITYCNEHVDCCSGFVEKYWQLRRLVRSILSGTWQELNSIANMPRPSVSTSPSSSLTDEIADGMMKERES